MTLRLPVCLSASNLSDVGLWLLSRESPTLQTDFRQLPSLLLMLLQALLSVYHLLTV